MKNNHIEDIYPKLDEVGQIIKFGRKEIVYSMKKSLNNFQENFKSLITKNEQQEEKIDILKKGIMDRQLNLDTLNNKYDLVSSFLGANPPKNEAMEKFKDLIASDFIEFANNESALAEEAKALLILQDVEKRLQDIITFPSIYNKNIVAVGGGFSAGKSEFINSFFMDKEIKLPVGINPVTAIPTYITVGKQNSIKGYSYKGGIVRLSSKLYKELSHDFIKSLGFNLKDIAPIMAIETPMKSYENICFIDTPGYNPANIGYTDSDEDTSKEYLKHANTLLWTIGIDTNGTIPASDLEFLESITLDDKKIYIVANKADLRSRDDIEDILDGFEEILDEYDIEYEGISAFSSINKEELEYRGISLFDFLEEVNNPVEVQRSILAELKDVFNMYRVAINEQILWTKNIQSHLKSLELDFLESGVDIEDNDKANERIENMRKLFNHDYLLKQLKSLETLEEMILQSAREVFISLE